MPENTEIIIGDLFPQPATGSDVLVLVDLHSFPSGMYVATLEMGGKVFSEKLVLKQ